MSKELEKLLEEKVEEVQEKQNEEKNVNTRKKARKTKKRKKILVRVIALILAGVTAVSCFFALKKKKDDTKDIPNSITVSVDDIGVEEIEGVYGETTGNINKEDLVEKNGVIWKDQAAADKSNQVGKVVTDTKNDTLVVKPNGEVHEKEIGYEVKDNVGNVVASGSNETGVPEGYVYDNNVGSYVAQEDANKFVTVDADYYDYNGDIIFIKGETVLKETFNKIKSQLTTTPNANYSNNNYLNNNYSNNNYQYDNYLNNNYVNDNYQYDNYPNNNYVTDNYGMGNGYNNYVENNNYYTQTEEGRINRDGTYTIYGTTYANKSTYETIAFGNSNEYDVEIDENGVIYLKGYRKVR